MRCWFSNQNECDGRYAGALILGYRRYPSLSLPPLFHAPPNHPLPTLATPQISTLLTTLSGVFVALVAFSMVSTISYNTLGGRSSLLVERERRIKRWMKNGGEGKDSRIYLWLPAARAGEGEQEQEGVVVLLDSESEKRLFDYGLKLNWTRAMGDRWCDWFGERCFRLNAVRTRN